jgi:hypothetical protein
MEVQHALATFTDAASINRTEQHRRAVRQGSKQVFGYTRIEPQLGCGHAAARRKPGKHWMLGHEPIYFDYGCAMNRATTFKGKDLLPQRFAQFPHGFYDTPGAG